MSFDYIGMSVRVHLFGKYFQTFFAFEEMREIGPFTTKIMRRFGRLRKKGAESCHSVETRKCT